MGSCQVDASSPSPKIAAAAFSWYQDAYNLTADELEGPGSPLVLMITGDLAELHDAVDAAETAGLRQRILDHLIRKHWAQDNLLSCFTADVLSAPREVFKKAATRACKGCCQASPLEGSSS